MEFLETTAKSRETGELTSLLHVGAIVRAAIVLVGIPHKLHFKGTRPYVLAAAIHNENGARTVYLLGYNEGVRFVRDIAVEAKARGLVSSFEIEDYNATIVTEVSRHKLARMTMVPGSGTKFLAVHKNLDEWPDLDEDIIEDMPDRPSTA